MKDSSPCSWNPSASSSTGAFSKYLGWKNSCGIFIQIKPLWNYSNQHKFFSSLSIKFSIVSSIPIQVVPNRLHFKRSLFLLYPGIRVAVSSFLFLSIFKDFFVRFWIFLAPTHKWKNTIITARHCSRSSDYKMPFSSST